MSLVPPTLTAARAPRANIITIWEGRDLDWRITDHGEDYYEAELLTRIDLTDREHAQAMEEAIEAYAE